MRSVVALVIVSTVSISFGSNTSPVWGASCLADTDCAWGQVCEPTIVGECESPHECVEGCRFGSRGCEFGERCVNVTCKTCPCPDKCEPMNVQTCGFRGAALCPFSQFCYFPQQTQCGIFSVGIGFCEDVPQNCPSGLDRICGCDGNAYLNECYMKQSRESPSGNLDCSGICFANPDLIQNGGFESSDVSDWDIRYRIRGKLWWRKDPPTGHPGEEVLDQQELPYYAKPYCGNRMLQLNDLFGGKHITRARRTIVLDEDLPCGGILRFRWGAALEEPGHKESEQPYFSIRVKNDGREIWSSRVTASEAGDGWEDVNWSGIGDPFLYRTSSFEKKISSASAGEKFEIELKVADCKPGDHAGAAFIDCLEIVDTCSPQCPTPFQSSPRSVVVPNAFSPGGDGINDTWDVRGVSWTCQIEVDIWDRWGVKVFKDLILAPKGQAMKYRVALWDGQRGSGPAPMSGNPYYYALKLVGCGGQQTKTGVVYLFR